VTRRRCAEALVRVVPARSRAIGRGSSSSFPRRSTTSTSCTCNGSRTCRRRCSVPTIVCVAATGFKLTDEPRERARDPERDSLLRAVPRARQGFVLEGAARQAGRVVANPLGIPIPGLPARREDLGDAPPAQGGRRLAGWPIVVVDNPMVPGHRGTASATTA
jgi:hypothetical protein